MQPEKKYESLGHAACDYLFKRIGPYTLRIWSASLYKKIWTEAVLYAIEAKEVGWVDDGPKSQAEAAFVAFSKGESCMDEGWEELAIESRRTWEEVVAAIEQYKIDKDKK